MTQPLPVVERDVARDAACTPCIRLFADHVIVTSTDGLACASDEALVPLVELGFAYASGPRDRAAELAARRVLERLGAIELACLDDVAAPPDCRADYVVQADGGAHAFCAFTERVLAQGRALGWRVEIDPAYPFHVVDREPKWYANIAPSDEAPDWFSLELGVDIDGARVDLLPMLLDMLDDLDEEGGLEALSATRRATWAIRVSDTHHVNVAVERLRALLRVVAELYQEVRGRAFPEARAIALAALDEVFVKTGASIAWTDPSGVAERARRFTAPLAPREPPRGLQASLRPYQAEGVAFLQRLREAEMGGVLADEMGLGKTLQTIAHILTEKAEGRLDVPALIVAPTTLVTNWARETARFAPELKVLILHGAARHDRWRDVAKADVVVTTYPVLVRDEERFAQQRFHLVVLDEAQAIKNAQSLARRALERVASEHRLCLTGTPVENHLGELWSIFDWLAPGLLGNELSFRRFYRIAIEKRADEERLAALRELVAPYVLRRLKRDVAKELPPKTELVVPVEARGKQRELYEALRVAAHADVRRVIRAKGFAASAVTILDALTKLRQVCCDPRLVAMEAARGVRESAKLEMLMTMLEEQLAGGHRVLIFSQFTSMLALIAEALRARGTAYLVLTGATRDRAAMVDAFEAGRADVFLISLKAGGTGLNLTSADTVIHYDPWWNPAAQAQATDRAYRIGQQRPVFVHNLYVAGSVEERVMALQQKKRWLSTTLLGDGAVAGPTLTENDVDALFAPIGT